MTSKFEASVNSKLSIRTIRDKEQAVGNALIVTPEDIKRMEPLWGKQDPIELDKPIQKKNGTYDVYTPVDFVDWDRTYQTVQVLKFNADGTERAGPSYGLNFNDAINFASQFEEWDPGASWTEKNKWRQIVMSRYQDKGLDVRVYDSDYFFRNFYGQSYFGTRSKNFVPTTLPIERLFQIANNMGHSQSPGLHQPVDKNGSWRSTKSLRHIGFFLLDCDIQTSEYPTGMTPDQIASHPIISNHAWAWSESISSRAPMKGGNIWKWRIWWVLPEVVSDKDYPYGFRRVLQDRIPEIDWAVAKDISRQSFGNARSGIEFHINGAIMGDALWEASLASTDDYRAEQEQKTRHTENRRHRNEKKDRQRDKLFQTAKSRGLIPKEYDTRRPIDAYLASTPIEDLMAEVGVIKLGSGQYTYDGSSGGAGVQFDPVNGVLTIYSSTMVNDAPHVWRQDKGSGDSTSAIRFYFWNFRRKPKELWTEEDKAEVARYTQVTGGSEDACHIGYDIAVKSDRDALTQLLASEGFGTLETPEDILRKETAPNSQGPSEDVDDKHAVEDERAVLSERYYERIQQDPSPRFNKRGYYGIDELRPEERILFENVLGISPYIKTITHEKTGDPCKPFTIRYPFSGLKGPENDRGYVWYRGLQGQCSVCDGHLNAFIKRHPPVAYTWCPRCEYQDRITSFAIHEIDRKAGVVINSDYEGYVSDDDVFKDVEPWIPGNMLHLTAPMGSGKTTWAHEKFKEMANVDKTCKGVMVESRITLNKSVHHIFVSSDGEKAWGLWCEGSENKAVGEIGAVSGVISLDFLIQKFIADDIKPSQVRMVIDEVDFVVGLLSGRIAEDHAVAIKKFLSESFKESGIVTMGQTANALSLEKLVRQLGGTPEDIRTYDKVATPNPAETLIIETCSVLEEDGVQVDFKQKTLNMLCQMLEDIYTVLRDGRNVYVFCREKRTAKDIETYINEFAKEELGDSHVTVVFTRHDKGGDDRSYVIEEGSLPKGKRALIANMSIDVGLSIYDEDGEVFVLVDGGVPSDYGGVFSSVQQCQRVRNARCRRIYHCNCNQSVPTVPSEEFEFERFFQKSKPYLVMQADDVLDKVWEDVDAKSASESINLLASYEFVESICYHLRKSGFTPKLQGGPKSQPISDSTLNDFKVNRQIVKIKHDIALIQKMQTLFPADGDVGSVTQLMTLEDIRKAADRNSLSLDGIDALALENAWHYSQLVGYEILSLFEKNRMLENEEEIPVMNTSQYNLCTFMGDNIIDYKMMYRFHRGFASVHYPHTDIVRETRDPETIEATSSVFDTFKGNLIQAVLKTVPETSVFKPNDGRVEELGHIDTYIHRAMFTKVKVPFRMHGQNEMHLGDILKLGGVAVSIARNLRFVNTTEPSPKLTKIVLDWVSRHYPVKFGKDRKSKTLRKYRHIQLGLVRQSVELRCNVFDTEQPHMIWEQELIPKQLDPRDVKKIQYEYDPNIYSESKEAEVETPEPEKTEKAEPKTQVSNDDLIFAMMLGLGPFTPKRAMEVTGLSDRQFRNSIKKLVNDGRAKKHGRGVYRLINQSQETDIDGLLS